MSGGGNGRRLDHPVPTRYPGGGPEECGVLDTGWWRGRIGPWGRAGCSLVQPHAGARKAGDVSRRYFLGRDRAFNPRVGGSSPRGPPRFPGSCDSERAFSRGAGGASGGSLRDVRVDSSGLPRPRHVGGVIPSFLQLVTDSEARGYVSLIALLGGGARTARERGG